MTPTIEQACKTLLEEHDYYYVPTGRNPPKATHYFETKQYAHYVLCRYRRHEQIRAFAEIGHHLSDCQYWKLFRKVWAGQHRSKFELSKTFDVGLWAACEFQPHRGEREWFIRGEADRAVYDSLPDDVTVYRGYGPTNAIGMYYTIARRVATRYALQFPDCRIEALIIPKAKILWVGGYFEQLLFVRESGHLEQLKKSGEQKKVSVQAAQMEAVRLEQATPQGRLTAQLRSVLG